MALIHIKRKHGLSREQVRAKVDQLAARLASEYKVKHAWDGDVLRFKRSGASGVVAVSDEIVDVKVKLGVVLVPLKGKIEKEILEVLDKAQASA